MVLFFFYNWLDYCYFVNFVNLFMRFVWRVFIIMFFIFIFIYSGLFKIIFFCKIIYLFSKVDFFFLIFCKFVLFFILRKRFFIIFMFILFKKRIYIYVFYCFYIFFFGFILFVSFWKLLFKLICVFLGYFYIGFWIFVKNRYFNCFRIIIRILVCILVFFCNYVFIFSLSGF